MSSSEVSMLSLNVINSPFNQEQVEQLSRLLPTLTDSQKVWLSGYLSGVMSKEVQHTSSSPAQVDGKPISTSTRKVTVLYGSETGTARLLSERMAEKLDAASFMVTLLALDDFKTSKLKKTGDLLIITATHGEGDPPNNAISFYEFLHSRKAPTLEQLRFSVLSLGDTSYEFFCQTGKDLDKRLEELGGERLYERVDCDLDFDEQANVWMDGVLDVLTHSSDAVDHHALLDQKKDGMVASEQTVFSRTNPFMAEVIENITLSGRGSQKQTHHLELSLDGSDFTFKPGDSIGIYPKNDPELVEQLLTELTWDADQSLTVNKQGEIRSLREALLSHFEITVLTIPMLEKAERLFANSALSDFVKGGNKETLLAYIKGRDVLDLVTDFPPEKLEPEEFVSILRKLPARLYSIASSYKANPDEVHLTIGKVHYVTHGRERFGVCSGQVSTRVEIGDKLPIYIQKNPDFQFPNDPQTPVIMIGPGTGVAPFRSYLEELEETKEKQRTWLFFGEQHFLYDFLYQVDWQKWLKAGVLSRMDVAFSRDTDQKVYVQHKMLQKSNEFYNWLKAGAAVYVCGDEKHMAKDVHQTLVTILKQEGDMSEEKAESYLQQMRLEKRYQRDVY